MKRVFRLQEHQEVVRFVGSQLHALEVIEPVVLVAGAAHTVALGPHQQSSEFLEPIAVGERPDGVRDDRGLVAMRPQVEARFVSLQEQTMPEAIPEVVAEDQVAEPELKVVRAFLDQQSNPPIFIQKDGTDLAPERHGDVARHIVVVAFEVDLLSSMVWPIRAIDAEAFLGEPGPAGIGVEEVVFEDSLVDIGREEIVDQEVRKRQTVKLCIPNLLFDVFLQHGVWPILG